MPYAAAVSTAERLSDAVHSVCEQVLAELHGARPDLSFVFVSPAHAEGFETIAATIVERTGSRVLLGCTGETIVGGEREIEEGPALSLWSAVLPEATVEPFHAQFSMTDDGVACHGLPEDLAAEAESTRAVFLLGEPFSTAPDAVIAALADELPGVPLLGGMASGGRRPGENLLFLDGRSVPEGAVGVVLRGGPNIRTIVSQGCRPIGTHYVVTAAEQNIVLALGGEPPLARLQELLPTLSERDHDLARQGLHLGVVMNEYQESFGRGDFLVANIVGADREHGAIALASRVRVGQTVQFHVRDADTADEDLRELTDRARAAGGPPPEAALLFSCNGRGTRLFGTPHHDAGMLQKRLGPLPLAGFFAQGELGPVGGRNYVHGFTASVALFEG